MQLLKFFWWGQYCKKIFFFKIALFRYYEILCMYGSPCLASHAFEILLSHPVYPAVNYTDWLAEPSETLEIKSLTWMCHSIFILKPKYNSKNYREFNYTQVCDWSLAPVFIINQFTVFSFICKGNLPVIKLTASVNSLTTVLIIVKIWHCRERCFEFNQVSSVSHKRERKKNLKI